MATPVPVVSMMYFLVVTPPKTLRMVSPAFAAMSVNQAMGFPLAGAGAGAGGWGCRGAEDGERGRKGKSGGSRPGGRGPRRSFWESMACVHGKWGGVLGARE